jgi:ribose 5-phosphate isomerase A
MDWREKAKRRAALEATRLVKDGFIVGLGSGSTVVYAIREIGRRIKREGLHVFGIPTSHQAFLLAVENGIILTTLDEHPEPDIAVDGADQIDKGMNLIKGMGGALTREKIVASASKKYVIVADMTKLTTTLGEDQSVPIEVLTFALSTIMQRISDTGGSPVLRMGRGKVGPVITDNGNFIVDVDFGAISSPEELNLKLKMIPGVVETGLFLDMADLVYVGNPTSVQKLERK